MNADWYFFPPSKMFIISLSHQSWLIIKVFTVLCGKAPALHCKYENAVHACRSDKNDNKKFQYELYIDMQFEFDRVRRLHMEEAQID